MKIKDGKIEFCCKESRDKPYTFGFDKYSNDIWQSVEIFNEDGFLQNEGTRIEQTIKFCPFCGVATRTETITDEEIERGFKQYTKEQKNDILNDMLYMAIDGTYSKEFKDNFVDIVLNGKYEKGITLKR
jgi:hypothetical protein